MKITVGVFFGGKSVEHEVSVISGLQALAALNREKYEPVAVYQGKDGAFYVGAGLDNIESYRNLSALVKGATQVDLIREGNKVWLKKRGALGKKLCALDVAMPVFHGAFGEDGCFQGLMEQLALPYTGCSVSASAVGMDKYLMKAAFKMAGVPCLECVKISRNEYYNDPDGAAMLAASKIGYPMIVKPYNLGSSVGIGKAKDESTLQSAFEEAFTYTDGVLCERCIENLREINCSVLGDSSEAQASVCEQPCSGGEFLSYADKYQSGAKSSKGGAKSAGAKSGGMASLSRLVPAPISEEMTKKAQETAVQAFNALGCRGVCRIDLMIDENSGELFVNEINTIPGSLSFYLWEQAGMSFPALLDRLISLAFKREREKAALVSSFDTNLLQSASIGGAKGSKGALK